jgi:flagellar protein FlbD
MIQVTRLDGTPMVVNADQIGWIEFLPDTVISLVNGEKLIVRESPEVIVERVEEYRRVLLVGGRRVMRLAPTPARPAAGGEEW